MKDNHISISEAKGRLGELVKRAAYGKEHFILEFRAKPQAAIVSYEDYRRLESIDERKARERLLLDDLWNLADQVTARTGLRSDSVKELREIREHRVDELTGLH